MMKLVRFFKSRFMAAEFDHMHEMVIIALF